MDAALSVVIVLEMLVLSYWLTLQEAEQRKYLLYSEGDS